MKKRVFGILLSLAMVVTMMPVLGLSQTAYATSDTNYVLKFSVTGGETPGSKTTTLPCTLQKADWLKLAGLDPTEDISSAKVATGDEEYLSLDGSGNLTIIKAFEGSKSITDVTRWNYTVRITCEVIKDPVPYIDADGSKKSCTDYKVVEDSDTNVVWGEDGKTTWYVVNDNVRISGGVGIYGDVNLILCDGAKLTVVGEIYSGNDSSITIYAQSTSGSMGSLEASSPIYVEDVTINGGAINARGIGAVNAATINGGTVNTNGGDGRPGIYTIDGAVTINGGEVYAESKRYDGIEGAAGDSTVTINGGTVTAIGGRTAIHGTLRNAIAGTGWTNVEGTEGKTAIEVNKEGQTLDETIKKAQFPAEVVKVTVKFDSDGGSPVADQSVPVNGKATKPADPTKDGYTFDGWYLGSTAFDFDSAIEKSITLTAHWKKAADKVTVKFNSAGGSAVDTQTIEKGAKATKPADPTRDGYTFDGWYLGGEEFDFDSPVKNNITLTAHWTKNETPANMSTITYDLNGGTWDGMTGIVTLEVENGTVITLPAPTRDGYTFDYWEGSRYNAGDRYTVNGDHTFKAIWKTGAGGDGSKGDSKGGSSSGKKGVNTGDENTLGAWIVLLIAALTGTTGMAFARKRRND